MAAYSIEPSKSFSSSRSLDDFQRSNIREKFEQVNLNSQVHQDYPEFLSDLENICDNPPSNLQNNSQQCESDLRREISAKLNHPNSQLDVNCAKSNNSVAPSFNVGGLVTTHYQSQPNLSDAAENYEETNHTNFVKEHKSHSIHPHSKSVEQPQCLHDQISQTNLACVIQDAIGKSCNVIQIEPPGPVNKLQSQPCSNSLNVTSYSIGRQFCKPTLGGVVEAATASHTGGASTIVVMMNGNSNTIQSNVDNEINQLPTPVLNNRSQDSLNSKQNLQQNKRLAKNFDRPSSSTNVSLYETADIKPQSSTHDLDYAMDEKRDSSQSGFKSSFAQEIEENVRNSSIFIQRNNERNFTGATSNNPFNKEHFDNTDTVYQRSLISPSSLVGRMSRDDGASLTSGYFDSSSIDLHQDDIFSKEIQSNNRAFDLTKMPSLGNQTEASIGIPPNNTWMTSSQFVKLLEMEEAKNNGNAVNFKSVGTSKGNSVKGFKRSGILGTKSNEEFRHVTDNSVDKSSSIVKSNNNSFLDKDAKFPFKTLQKTCTDLGFIFSEQEWCQLAKTLTMGENNTKDFYAKMYPDFNEEINSDKKSNRSKIKIGSAEAKHNHIAREQDVTVRNGDFFAALHMFMKDKNNYLRNDITKHPGHKSSMKSDSGGEMESCRSSDSEIINEPSSCTFGQRERSPNKRSTQRSSISSQDSAERNKSSIDADGVYHNSLNELAEQLAERDTELLRTKLECQRLNKLVTHAQFKSEKAMDTGSKFVQHRRRNLELEKEVDNLKWQLSAMESSRKTYEEATQRLVSFLEQVTTVLQGTSPVQRKLLEATRAEVSKVARRARIQGSQPYLLRAAKRFSLDSISQNSLMSRAESMPGLNSGFGGSLLSLSTSTTEASSTNGGNSPMTASSNKKFTRKLQNDLCGRDTISARESISSRNSSDFSTGQNYYEKSGYKTLPSSHYASSSNSRSLSAGKSKQRIKRSQSTSSGGGNALGSSRHNSALFGLHSRTQSPMPSLKEQEYPLPNPDHSSSMYMNGHNNEVMPSQNRESRKSRTSFAYVNNDIVNGYAKTSSLKSANKRSTSRSRSGCDDQRKQEAVAVTMKTKNKSIRHVDNNSRSSQSETVPNDFHDDGKLLTENENKSFYKYAVRKENNLKQVIKIGNCNKINDNIQESTLSNMRPEKLKDIPIYEHSDENGDENGLVSNQDKGIRKYIPRRSASIASIREESNNLSQNAKPTNEISNQDVEGNTKDQNHTLNKISARFSLSSGVAKAKNKKTSQISKDKSLSSPMPIEAIVQVVTPSSVDKSNMNDTKTPEARSQISQHKMIEDSYCNVTPNHLIPKNETENLLSNECSSDNLCSNDVSNTRENTVPTPSTTSTIQVLVSSNSNNPAALRSETRLGVELGVGSAPLLKDQTKFKSLGDLHMEKGLPPVPRVLPASDLKTKGHMTEDEDSNGSPGIVRDRLANNAHKLLRSMKQLLAREKTVNITGSGPSSCSSQIAGGGIKNGVIITSSKTTDNSTKSLKTIQRDSAKTCEASEKVNSKNISKISINQNDVRSRQDVEAKQKQQMQVTQAFPYDARVNLQLLSTMSFPGLPSYPALAASKSSPWNC